MVSRDKDTDYSRNKDELQRTNGQKTGQKSVSPVYFRRIPKRPRHSDNRRSIRGLYTSHQNFIFNSMTAR